MPRARLYRPVLDEMGNVVADVFVRLIDPETNINISSSIYLGPVTTDAVSQPIHFPDGVISLYTDSPQRVRIGIKKGTQAEKFFEDIDILVTDLGGLPALGVVFDPTDDLVADDVQEAIVEVHTKGKAALKAHLDDPTDAHDASAISFTPASSVDATNVQDAIAEVGAEIERIDSYDHQARLAALEEQGFQTAAQTPFTPPTGMVATQVQAAIEEVFAADSAGTIQTAEETPFAPTADILSTDVQAAIQEAYTKAVAAGGAGGGTGGGGTGSTDTGGLYFREHTGGTQAVWTGSGEVYSTTFRPNGPAIAAGTGADDISYVQSTGVFTVNTQGLYVVKFEVIIFTGADGATARVRIVPGTRGAPTDPQDFLPALRAEAHGVDPLGDETAEPPRLTAISFPTLLLPGDTFTITGLVVQPRGRAASVSSGFGHVAINRLPA